MRVFTLIVSVLIPLLVGGFSAFLTSQDMNIYESAKQPLLAPPGWLFPIVWTILYVMMGIASYLVYASDADYGRKRTALTFYAVQLIMNFFWSMLFFTYRMYMIALVWLLIMWVLIIICAIRFYRIRRAAGILMCVLILWTTFAAYLNLAWYVISITPLPIAE